MGKRVRFEVGALPPHPRKGRDRPLTPPRERWRVRRGTGGGETWAVGEGLPPVSVRRRGGAPPGLANARPQSGFAALVRREAHGGAPPCTMSAHAHFPDARPFTHAARRAQRGLQGVQGRSAPAGGAGAKPPQGA